jgi:2-oxoglutarate ferredoxin oxidoreductase subunit alpha
VNQDVRFLQGNESVVEGALYAGLQFFAGYPITPSSEITEILSERLPQIGGKFIQMEDEIASMCAVIGASLTGLKVMTATSGPGFSLMQEAIGYAVMAEIPSVVVNVQRGGPSTGMPTSVAQGDVLQARWGTHGDHSIITLTASNLQDMFLMTVEAFNLAETFRTPVILLLDEVVAHMREKLVIPLSGEVEVVERLRTSVPKGTDYHPYLAREDGRLPMSDFGGTHRYNVTGLVHDMWGFPSNDPKEAYDLLHHLVDKLENRADSIVGQECVSHGG